MTTNIKDEALKLALEALEESLGYVEEEAENAQRLYGQYPTRQARIQGLKDDARKHMNAITAIREALAEHIEQHLEMVEQSTCKQALQVEQPAQIPDALERLMRESDKPTQVPEQLAKYVAAIVQGTHEITSVTIRPKRASKPWVGLTDEQIEEIAARTLFPVNFARAIEARLKELNT